jgi:hypothetical protein
MALPVNRYGQGPEQLFFPASPLAGRAPPPAVQPTPAVEPAPVVNELFRDTLNTDLTTPAPDNPHPNPSVGAALKSAAMGLGLMSPMGLGMGLMSLAISDAMGMKPTLSRTDVMSEMMGRATGRSPYAEINEIADPAAAIGNKPAAALNVASIFSGGEDNNGGGNQTGQTSGAPGVGTGAGNAGPGDNQNATNMAGGGVVELFGGGKVAVGPGGGMDDRIPTTIDGGRLANLSDGEFVIPADVVSAMGDGSTNAGATRLYDLVKAIRQQKTGTERQAQPVQFDQILKQVTGR